IVDVLNQDKPEHEIAADLRELDADLSRLPELYSAVFDKLAADKIISKSKYRDYLKIQAPAT
ncbi:MAG: hypothetical protein ACTS5I_16630, partial [Rhodanobacter sp.]